MRTGLGTIALIVFTLYWSYRGLTNPWFRDKYIFSPPHVLVGRQYYRLLSCGFLHLNGWHLLFNMMSLYSVGAAIEISLGLVTGQVVLYAVFLGSIVGGSLLSLLLHRNDSGYRALGASGGVCGVIFAFVFLFPGTSMIFFFIPMPSWLYAILFILISFFALRNQWGHIGHDAHLGGAIVGLLITTALYPSIVVWQPVLYGVVMGLSVLLFIDLYRNPLYLPGQNPLRRSYWRSRLARFRARRQARQELDDQQTLDRLLAKISRSGLESLTASEKRKLKAISKRMRESGRVH
jgi:membrane associated rhomboid family serine protease